MSLARAPDPLEGRFAFSTVVFLRLLALIHVIAFASALTQISSLVGPHGLSPAGPYLAAAREQLGSGAVFQLPTLCWAFGCGIALPLLCVSGIVAAGLLFCGFAPPLALLWLWAAYLSITTVGQQFFGFQWDGLLLEAALVSVFVAPWRWRPGWRAVEPPPVARWLLWWLLFRLMFFAGVVKLSSGDPTWRNLTALTFHYETQPLPTPLAWYAHQAPLGWHQLECAGMFVIELGVPFALAGPRWLRQPAALVMAALMLAIAATGNYTFFNALAIALCLGCLDDAWWYRVLRLSPKPPAEAESALARAGDAPPGVVADYPLQRRARPRLTPRQWAVRAFAVFAIGYTGVLSLLTLNPRIGAPPGLESVARVVEPLRSFNTYGLFAVMTHPRTELIVEGSNDGRTWAAYEFPAKPGDLAARPTFVAPLQPRLDWQMWFAALGSPSENPWILALCEAVLRGTPDVLRLFAHNPFPAAPPKYVRVVRYEYHFTTPGERRRTGNWWKRTPLDVYVPASTLPAGLP